MTIGASPLELETVVNVGVPISDTNAALNSGTTPCLAVEIIPVFPNVDEVTEGVISETCGHSNSSSLPILLLRGET